MFAFINPLASGMPNSIDLTAASISTFPSIRLLLQKSFKETRINHSEFKTAFLPLPAFHGFRGTKGKSVKILPLSKAINHCERERGRERRHSRGKEETE